MSRVGNAPITVPSGVDVAIEGRTVVVTGAKGTLRQDLPGDISLQATDGAVQVERPDDTAQSKSLHGLTRSLVQNMVTGVSEGFTKELRIQGVGYRVAESTPTSLELSLGFSHSVKIAAPDGVEFEVPQRTQILVKGIDKQLVGQVAADIRKWRPPEPYKGKGIRYADERVKRKAGKAAK
ncbi:MAG: 50S ribosomal protein L6 [Acidimicrobiaceae bacterium]|nr:50S ribosomal protein L6 [Acidimicrobiaceae bacterium]